MTEVDDSNSGPGGEAHPPDDRLLMDTPHRSMSLSGVPESVRVRLEHDLRETERLGGIGRSSLSELAIAFLFHALTDPKTDHKEIGRKVERYRNATVGDLRRPTE